MEFDDKVPIYYQIEQYVCSQIINKTWAPGDKVPAVRQLALTLSVNGNTVQRALTELIQNQVLESRRGLGNFVTTDPEILAELRQQEIEAQFEQVQAHLAALQMSPEEMLGAFSTYLSKHIKEEHHE